VKFILAFLITFLPSIAFAEYPLQRWPCNGLGEYYGYIALDRDAGMSLKDRINKTVNLIITAVDSPTDPLDAEADDAQSLLTIVYFVYSLPQLTPRQHTMGAIQRCLGGYRAPVLSYPLPKS